MQTFNGKPATEAQLVAGITDRQLSSVYICTLARLIRKDWGAKMFYGAKPYANAMLEIEHVNDRFGNENAKDVVIYFLSNAGTWRGEVAKAVKAELKRRCGLSK